MRSGVGKDGKRWQVALPDHYGYIKRTEGSDGDHVDCYIGRHPLSSRVFVINQVDADSGEHDEFKCLLGYLNREQALSAYHRAFSDGRAGDRIGSVQEMSMERFKKWLQKEGGLPEYASGGRVGFAEGGTPAFDPAEFSAFKAQTKEPAAEPAGFNPAEFAAFKTADKPSANTAPTAAAPENMVNKAAPYLRAVPFVGPAASVAAEHFDPAYLADAARNVPHSAVEFGKNVVQPVVHPVETLTNLKNLGLGILEKTGLVSGGEHEKYADAVGRYFADRYGSIDAAKEAFRKDPVGVAGDASMLLTGGEMAAGRVPGIIGQTARAAGEVGRAVDPLQAVSAAARATGEGAGHLLGVTTGAGNETFRVAQRAGYQGGPSAQAFRENITGAAPLEATVEDARRAVQQMRIERGNAYRQQMGPIKADSTVLDFNKIDQAVAGAQGIKTYSGRSGTGPTQILDPKTAGIRQEMTDAIEHWKNLDPAEFHTPEGIDALKQQLSDIRNGTEYGSANRKVADNIYNAVRQTIVDQVPEYAKVMKGYEEASKQLGEIERTLSLNPKASIDTALRKLQSTLRDNVNTSFGHRKELANFLVNAGAPNLMERLAGQSLSAWMPRGLPRMLAAAAVEGPVAMATGVAGAAKAIPALATMSPRLMGELAYGVGRARRAMEPFAPAVPISRQIGQVSRAAAPFGVPGNPYAPQ